MTKKARKIATYCMIGTLAFMGRAATAEAAGEPVAGISVLVNEVMIKSEIKRSEILEYLKPKSEYSNLAIAKVSNYVNIRSKASESSKILGKLYNNSAATILEEQNDWVKVKSGKVTGYIKSDYLVTGSEVDKIAEKAGTKIAEVTTTTLNVRNKADIDSSIITMVPIGEELKVLAEQEDWIKISVDNNSGFVSSDYVDIKTEFKQAVSIEEEQERQRQENQNSQGSDSATMRQSSDGASSQSSGKSSSLRQNVVDYALRFQGNPYVWGGTSLTNGADCSGFTQSVFRHFGIGIPRTSRSQAGSGKRVSVSEVRPGDLIFYTKNGRINHVALYIGNGKVIGASSSKEGIRIKNMYYRTPYKAVSYFG